MNSLVLLFLLALPVHSQPEGVLQEAIQLFGKGEYRQARDFLAEAGDSWDDPAEIRFWLGKTYLKTGRWDDAVKAMEKAVQMKPSNAMYRLWLGRAYGSRAENRIFGFNDARRVIREFKKAGELEPENIDIRFDLLEFYAQAPGIVGGGKDKAWAEAGLISRLMPEKGYIARATVYRQEGKWDLAEKELRQATLDYPSEAAAHKDLAQFFLDRRDFSRALASARKALELNPASKQTRYIVAASQIGLGRDPDETEAILRGLTREPLGEGGPSFEDVYCQLGILYLGKGEKEKSRDAFLSALHYNPDYEKAGKYLSELE
ncbi:MAG: tetratricopeptide repeat protein [Acidobacteria bacterium]|nr:tetratricopeptide repeat protein [Acidobacteriota bacterium]